MVKAHTIISATKMIVPARFGPNLNHEFGSISHQRSFLGFVFSILVRTSRQGFSIHFLPLSCCIACLFFQLWEALNLPAPYPRARFISGRPVGSARSGLPTDHDDDGQGPHDGGYQKDDSAIAVKTKLK